MGTVGADGMDGVRRGDNSFDNVRDEITSRYPNADVSGWSDADISSMSLAEQTAVQWAREVGAKLGVRMFFLNTGAEGVDLKDAASIKAHEKTASMGGTLFAEGMWVPGKNGEGDILLISAKADGYNGRVFPAKVAIHETVHALISNAKVAAQVQGKIIANPTLLKAFNDFRNSPDGIPYDQKTIHEEFLCRVLARQFGSNADAMQARAIMNELVGTELFENNTEKSHTAIRAASADLINFFKITIDKHVR